jgi:putative membrane protein (TIGR04086 family)
MEKKSMPYIAAACVKALIIACLTTVILLFAISFVMYKANPGENVVSLGIIFTYILSCFLGGLYLGHKMDKRKFLWGLGTGLCYFTVLILLSAAVPVGAWMDIQHLVTSCILCLGGGCLGGMLA